MESSLPECEGSPLEAKNKLSLGLKTFLKWSNCVGIIYYRDEQYEGEFVRGKFSGYGVYTYDDGEVYVGEFSAGKSNGQ